MIFKLGQYPCKCNWWWWLGYFFVWGRSYMFPPILYGQPNKLFQPNLYNASFHAICLLISWSCGVAERLVSFHFYLYVNIFYHHSSHLDVKSLLLANHQTYWTHYKQYHQSIPLTFHLKGLLMFAHSHRFFGNLSLVYNAYFHFYITSCTHLKSIRLTVPFFAPYTFLGLILAKPISYFCPFSSW